MATYLLSPVDKKKEILPEFKRNMQYASHINRNDIPQKECLKYLPGNFNYSGNLFFTFGYDLGVVYGKNASVNLAHPQFIKDINEIKYYAIHELHHAGFVVLKKTLCLRLT